MQVMTDNKTLNYITNVLKNLPADWLNLTTHRLDLYDEKLAKTQFLKAFEVLFENNNAETKALSNLPTAYDYIRLGHPLSCLLEWVIANLNELKAENVISFSSKTIPVLAILRKNALENKNTQIIYTGELPEYFDIELLKRIYGYKFELKHVEPEASISELNSVPFDGSTIFISQEDDVRDIKLSPAIDFYVSTHNNLGSILLINGVQNETYISAIQHVRRRETIAMTPTNSLAFLKLLTAPASSKSDHIEDNQSETLVLEAISSITGTHTKAILGSSGLSIQYAIMMGLIHDALDKHKGKAIKFIVPPNCYGGTNDQARRVAACVDNVEVVDLPVDGDHEMVQSIELILARMAEEDAVPYIIAEIPTNPRVEVPDLFKLKEVLSTVRKTPSGSDAVSPVFILDQTFCPNTLFLGENEILSTVRTISYVSGSKFPSGGLCTAGYCVANKITEALMEKIELHLRLCDNVATKQQIEILAKQLPSMNERIHEAYLNTREFVNFIQASLPEAKINFVSETLAKEGFTPSVFSLDLPTKGNTDVEKEAYKRALNYKLIKLMINEIPNECKFCVSYGQLNGSYWTIPATSTQGTTKEGDKDYIVRVSFSPNMDVGQHKKAFANFAKSI
jgi:cystathionine beta-lyase/cystathionine gamma-synthase